MVVKAEPILPVPIPHSRATCARGMRAGSWVFATGLSGTDYVSGMAPEVLQAGHPLNGEPREKLPDAEWSSYGTAAASLVLDGKRLLRVGGTWSGQGTKGVFLFEVDPPR